jgi:hypothetical protein
MVKLRKNYCSIPKKISILHPKIKLFIIILILFGAKINALEISYSFSLFKIYNGFNMSENEISFEFTGNLVNFNIINENTGIGIDISPIKFFYSSWVFTQNISQKSNILSFVNIYLFWDIFSIITPYEYGVVRLGGGYPGFGPFFSINWINIDDIAPFNINKLIFSAGLKHSRGIRWGEYGGQIMNNHTHIDIEAGYRNIYGNHGFFLTIQFNLLEYLIVRVIGA